MDFNLDYLSSICLEVHKTAESVNSHKPKVQEVVKFVTKI